MDRHWNDFLQIAGSYGFLAEKNGEHAEVGTHRHMQNRYGLHGYLKRQQVQHASLNLLRPHNQEKGELPAELAEKAKMANMLLRPHGLALHMELLGDRLACYVYEPNRGCTSYPQRTFDGDIQVKVDVRKCEFVLVFFLASYVKPFHKDEELDPLRLQNELAVINALLLELNGLNIILTMFPLEWPSFD